MAQPPRYTDEVLAAMRARGLLEHGPQLEPPPAGHVRYHVAVEETVLSGTAPPSVVAAALRGLADQITQET